MADFNLDEKMQKALEHLDSEYQGNALHNAFVRNEPDLARYSVYGAAPCPENRHRKGSVYFLRCFRMPGDSYLCDNRSYSSCASFPIERFGYKSECGILGVPAYHFFRVQHDFPW